MHQLINKKPLLSICVPTRNQPHALERLLRSIVMQEKVCSVEVVINDDSYGDESEKIAKSYESNLDIRYKRRSGSGIDAGIIELVEAACGLYIWFIGDDDIAVNAISLIESCSGVKARAGFIYADTQNHETGRMHLGLREDCFFKDSNELLLLAGTGLAFISSNIMLTDLAKKSLSYIEKFQATDFANFALTINVISNSKCQYYLKGPIAINFPHSSAEIKKRVLKDGVAQNNFFFIFALTWKKIMKDHESVFGKDVVRKLIRLTFGTTWRGVLVGWAGGWDSPKAKRILLLKHFWSFPEAWVAFVLFCMPSGLNKLMYSSYRRVKYGWLLK
jgi:glycosyltransferase involved in cell wall biosynthesis